MPADGDLELVERDLHATNVVREWREDIERDHRIYDGVLCKRCVICGWKWQQYLGGDLDHDEACVVRTFSDLLLKPYGWNFSRDAT